ncbi:MAG TPA: ribose ABC transporter permease [Stellaceae bacterium]|jgi:phosphatidylethanolamine/phosphatidyl-N-methylethanolamine N-methyltransferase|nr:ribose ABC transporter permease [Stellaceae bacterium]
MSNFRHIRRKPSDADNDLALFLSRWIRAPLRIGALAPSSPYLGREMARAIDARAAKLVVELGGGTGRITRALLDAGVPPERLIVVENDDKLASLLRIRFPQLRIVHGDASDLLALLRPFGVTHASAVVSGLPLLSMPAETQQRIVEEAFALMGEDGTFVQFTYGPVSPVMGRARVGLIAEVTGRVWRNFPPASVWRYRRQGSAA